MRVELRIKRGFLFRLSGLSTTAAKPPKPELDLHYWLVGIVGQ